MATGGSATGGSSTGGAVTGGTATGGMEGSGGGSPPMTGGAAGATTTGGTPSGGAINGGSAGIGGSTGGSGGQAGAAAGTSGGGGGSADPCSAAGLLFCDDFEGSTVGGPPDASKWKIHLNGDGTVSVDGTTPAHSGQKSVTVNATGYQTFFGVTGAPVFPAPSGKLYLRLYIRLSEAMPGGHNTYFEAGLDASSDAQFETRVGVMFEQLMINQPDGDRGFLSNQNYYNDNLPGVQIEPMTWTCVEAYFDSPGTEVRIWVEEEEATDLHVLDWQQEDYDSLRFGYEKYAGPNAVIGYDDIAVGTERIGCF